MFCNALQLLVKNAHYVKPIFSDDRQMVIKDGRHPVVEKVMNIDSYVPNDCVMNNEREILLDHRT